MAVVEERVRQIERDVVNISTKVDEMHAILMQANGAKWAILSIAGLAGFLAGMAAKLAPFINGSPLK
jgi:phosphoribosylcarboxyaminoimidazole (NCAIR) mutase